MDELLYRIMISIQKLYIMNFLFREKGLIYKSSLGKKKKK